MTYLDIAREAYYIAYRNGFYAENKPINQTSAKSLILTEISEAIQAERNGKYSGRKDISLHLPIPIYKLLYKWRICGSVEDEIADAALRTLTLYYHYFQELPQPVHTITPLNLTELLYYASRYLTDHQDIAHQLSVCFTLIRNYAFSSGIDIEHALRRKTRFNHTRGHLHGKRY